MKIKSVFILLQTIVFTSLGSITLYAQLVKFSEPITSEKVIHANIEVESLHLMLNSENSPQVYNYFSSANNPVNLSTHYELHGTTGILNITSNRRKNASRHKTIGWELFASAKSAEPAIAPLKLSLTDSIPLKLNISVGSSTSDFDLTGLKLKELKMNIGACNSKVIFSKPNPTRLKHMHVSTGASQLTLSGLGFANFDVMTFKGGVTDVTMDFEGDLNRKSKVDVRIDAGNLTIYIPKNLAVKLQHTSHFFSNVTLPDDFTESNGFYYSKNYGKTSGTLIMYLKSGAGSVNMSWK